MLQPQAVSVDVLREKYAKGAETSADEIYRRVAKALAGVEARPEVWEERFYEAMRDGFIPAGRIMSAAGAGIQATLINCFVQGVGDSMLDNIDGKPGIMNALGQAAETMRRGGGVGYDFSRIRPGGAFVKKTRSTASGPLEFMDLFNAMCKTVESAGARRGAQMGVLRCDHPDIEAFIDAKGTKGRFTQFNLSIGVTDAFMQSVEADAEWDLIHKAEPAPSLIADGAYQRIDGVWVYRKVRARALWDKVMRNTYDHAEPGVLFIDKANAENNLHYCETFEACNPCVTDDTWVMTNDGPRQVKDLIGKQFVAVIDGVTRPSGVRGFYHTGRKPVVLLKTKEGYSLRLTANHLVRKVTRCTPYVLETEWVEAGQLKGGDEVLMQDHRHLNGWIGRSNWQEGYLLGLLLGDGHITDWRAVLAVWDNNLSVAANGDVVNSPAAKSVMDKAYEAICTLKSRSDFKGWMRVRNSNQFRMTVAEFKKLALSFGMSPGAKYVTPAIEATSSEFYRGFLQGLFDTDGTVEGSHDKGISVRLCQGNLETLEAVQRMLVRLGIFSSIYRNRHPGGPQEMPDGHGGTAIYVSKPRHDLVISNDNLLRFEALVGFSDISKAERLAGLLGSYKRMPNRERFVARIESVEENGVDDVYDVEIDDLHEFDANGFHAHNCAEEFLPDYGCCCLGSVDITRFVREPFTNLATFDYDAFGKVVGDAVRMLDNVLEVTYWPLAQQKQEAMNKRRIGLGYTGLGDALIMLGYKYDTPEARAMASRISEEMRNVSYRASIELAKEKGAFPLLDADKYLQSGFAKRLPEDIKQGIRLAGIRNSHLNAIAPTGTISLAFADNASNGIEPPFSWVYTRKKRQADNSKKEYLVEDHAFRLYRSIYLPELSDQQVSEMRIEDLNAKLPPNFVTALGIAAKDHQAMVSTVQQFIDTSISKTVNVPSDYPFEEFANLYLDAWKSGAKGLATFRPNDITGSVLSVEPAKADQKPDLDESDPDRRLTLKEVPVAPLASLRWRKRPQLPAGNPAWCYMVNHPLGYKFAVFIGHVANGENHPFEVWVNGAEQPRGLGALAKSISMDMRSMDRAWLKRKLEALGRASGDDAFAITMPPQGIEVLVPSLVAGFAKLVEHRCAELGVFGIKGESPVLDALMSTKEPKTGPDGTLSWTVDILNPATGDDFVMGLKELVMPNGQRRPYSVWLSGEYPRVLDGLCKSLSYDMRVVDPAWAGAKLRQLLDFSEAKGDFLAKAPMLNKSINYPSTVAYMARLMVHRYAMLGILDEEGYPLDDMGAMAYESDNVVSLKAVRAASAGAMEVTPGKRCSECGNYALIRKDGCDFCTACGTTGTCG